MTNATICFTTICFTYNKQSQSGVDLDYPIHCVDNITHKAKYFYYYSFSVTA